MQSLKSTLKYLFQITHSLRLLDKLNFKIAKNRNKNNNNLFKKLNPDFSLPPDYYLYETYKLDYHNYKEDGLVSAREIIEWTAKYTPDTKTILEWGCGVSRVVRHLNQFISKDSVVFACDINEKMIAWDKANIANVTFDLVSYLPPTNYEDKSFDLIYALSVFTHIESTYQVYWIKEIARIIKPGGVFLFTTHGRMYFQHLKNKQLKALTKEGRYTIMYHQKGHRMMGTFNVYDSFRKEVEHYFEVLEYYDGSENVSKVGGQDLWIVKRK